jgi:hypothetical protein
MAAPRANCRPAWPRCRVGPQPDDPPGPRNLCKRDGDAKPDHIQSSAGGNLTTSSAVNSQMQQVLKRNSACARLVLARSALPFRADSTSSPNDCTGWQFRHAAAFQCRRITVLSQQTMIASSWAAFTVCRRGLLSRTTCRRACLIRGGEGRRDCPLVATLADQTPHYPHKNVFNPRRRYGRHDSMGEYVEI